MPIVIQPFYTVHSHRCSLIVDCRGNAPAILYWGSRLSNVSSPEMLALLATRQEVPACMPEEAVVSLSPEFGAGFSGSAGVQIHRGGTQWSVYSQIQSVSIEENNRLSIVSRCRGTEIELTHCLQLDSNTDVLCATTQLTNIGETELWLDRCDAPCIPIPMHYSKILGFKGRWANEFQTQSLDRFAGAYLRENRSGRTSHDSFPAVVVHTEQANESTGEAYGLHLGWSGNHHIRVEEQFCGRAYAQLGELFYPGELSLEPGESYRSPVLYGASSATGFSDMSARYHQYIRNNLTDSRLGTKPKPIHFNTWEAMYFNLSMVRLCKLADEAVAVGAERFVLDDGWFKGRRSDCAGLGDWVVDQTIFPQGLGPLVEYVNRLGMEFGLWVEPEMVNPDSDLYRAHPNWVLDGALAPQLLSRNQLVLDLTRTEVHQYLFERLDQLLSDYPITYLKWDMNRTINQPGNAQGRAVTHYQTSALYHLLARIRATHPQVEIESCSSGGGRADFGILSYTDRIWTSDSNDALDRLRIQKGFSLFFPAEIMGSHVGSRQCHITGRSISMATRAGVALFGNMGIEANLLDMDDADKTELAAAVALHKKHRQLIHSGNLVRLDTHSYENSFGIIAANQQQALFCYALLDSQPNSAPERLRFRGLNSTTLYIVNIIWPLAPSHDSKSILDVIDGAVVSGDALANIGIQLPLMFPETLLVFHLQS